MIFRFCVSVLVLSAIWAGPAECKRYELWETDSYDLDVSTKSGLRFRIRDPKIELRLGGRLHGDLAFFDDDRTPIGRSDAQIRRGRIYLKGLVLEDFAFKIEREFASPRVGWRNLWVRYKPSRSFSIKAGNFVAPFGLEAIASSNDATLMERAVSSVLAPGYQTGVRVDLNGKFGERNARNRWTFGLAALTNPLGQSSDDLHRSKHFGFAARATFAPIARRRWVLHFGVASEYRNLQNQSKYRVRTRPESGLAPALYSTGMLADVDSVTTIGVEVASILGSFTFQGEYMRSFLQRSGGRDDPSFEGGYGQISYVLTGEHRRYSRARGVILGLRPKRWWGAVEIAARVSALNLDDATVTGGKTRDVTLGLNWYLQQNLRLMFNYINVDGQRRGAARESDDPQIFQFRFQLFF